MLPVTGLRPETGPASTLSYSVGQTFIKTAQVQEERTQTPHLNKSTKEPMAILNLSKLLEKNNML